MVLTITGFSAFPSSMRVLGSSRRELQDGFRKEIISPVCLLIMPGDYRGEATPVPIPNTEVKLFNADGTALGWESRSSPGFFI